MASGPACRIHCAVVRSENQGAHLSNWRPTSSSSRQIRAAREFAAELRRWAAQTE
jgi:hypothetical protein